MSNLDKDIEKSIEIVKKMKRCSLTGGFDKQTERLKAIFTVTAYLESMRENKEDLYKELERYKQYYEEQNEVNKKFVSKEKFDETNKELETYKKIAEKLVDKILEMDIDGEVYDFFCKYIPMEKCDEFSDGYCDKCIIDWARNEVEKDV